MQRVVILGRGGAGKSTLAKALSTRMGLPCIELDDLFWSDDLEPKSKAEWIAIQEELVREDTWILDGDLGPYDALEIRLRRADTVIVLDLSTIRCVYRAVRRGSRGLDFWRWQLTWRQRSWPTIRAAIARDGADANVIVLRHPRDVRRLLSEARQ